MPTLRTKEPVGPTTGSQVLLASLLGRELHLKLTQTLRRRDLDKTRCPTPTSWGLLKQPYKQELPMYLRRPLL